MELQEQLDAALAVLRLGEQMREWQRKFFKDTNNKAALRASKEYERLFDDAVEAILHPRPGLFDNLFGDPPVPDKGQAGRHTPGSGV